MKQVPYSKISNHFSGPKRQTRQVIEDLQCEDWVTKRKERKHLQAREVICLHKDKDSFCNKLDEVLAKLRYSE